MMNFLQYQIVWQACAYQYGKISGAVIVVSAIDLRQRNVYFLIVVLMFM